MHCNVHSWESDKRQLEPHDQEEGTEEKPMTLKCWPIKNAVETQGGGLNPS